MIRRAFFFVALFASSFCKAEIDQTCVIYITDTLVAGERVHLRFPVANDGTDSLVLFSRNDFFSPHDPWFVSKYAGTGQKRITVSGPGPYQALARIGPSDSSIVGVWMTFSATGQRVETILRAENGKIVQLLAYAGEVVNGTTDKPGEINYRNGRPMERISSHGKNGITYRAWYKNGNPKTEAQFDEMNRKKGTWRFYSEDGKLLQETVYRDHASCYVEKEWYENGQLKSRGEMKGVRRVGKWQEFYADGSKKMEAKYRQLLVVNIYTYKVRLVFSRGSSAKYYREYYPSGGKKVEAFYSLSARRRGTWRAWYENGELASSRRYFHDKERKREHFMPGGVPATGMQSFSDPLDRPYPLTYMRFISGHSSYPPF